MTSVSNGPPSQVVLTAQDSSGLQAVHVPWHSNATFVITGFTPGTTNPVTLTFTKQVETLGASASVTAVNTVGAKAFCVAISNTVTPGRASSVSFHFRASRNMLVIQNDATNGLTAVGVVVDATTEHVPLTPGQTYTQDISSLIHPSPPSNTLVVEGHGKTGASAVAIVWGEGPPA